MSGREWARKRDGKQFAYGNVEFEILPTVLLLLPALLVVVSLCAKLERNKMKNI